MHIIASEGEVGQQQYAVLFAQFVRRAYVSKGHRRDWLVSRGLEVALVNDVVEGRANAHRREDLLMVVQALGMHSEETLSHLALLVDKISGHNHKQMN